MDIIKKIICEEFEGYKYRKCITNKIIPSIFMGIGIIIVMIALLYFNDHNFLTNLNENRYILKPLLIFWIPGIFSSTWYLFIRLLNYTENTFLIGFIVALLVSGLFFYFILTL